MEVSTNNQFVKEIDLYQVKTWIVIYRRYRSERLSLIWKLSKKLVFKILHWNQWFGVKTGNFQEKNNLIWWSHQSPKYYEGPMEWKNFIATIRITWWTYCAKCIENSICVVQGRTQENMWRWGVRNYLNRIGNFSNGTGNFFLKGQLRLQLLRVLLKLT